MTHEDYPITPNQQIAIPLEVMRRQQLTPDVPFALDMADPKIPYEQAYETYGIGGDIVGVIALPVEKGKGEQQVAIVDYGLGRLVTEPTPDERAVGKRPDSARFALVGLNYSGSEGQRLRVVLPPAGEVTFGRNPAAHNAQLGLLQNRAISRKQHFSVQTSPDGVVVTDRGSSYGTKIVGNELSVNTVSKESNIEDIENTIRRPVGTSALLGAKEADLRMPEGGQETQYGFTQDQLRVSVDKDERFTAITAPFNARLTELYQAYRGGKMSEREWRAQSQPVRNQLEQAVKPYLTERLHTMSTDTQAGYLHTGALYRQATSVVTRDGKKIAWSIGGGHWSGEDVRMGQITLPKRFPNWGGGHGEKVNRKTNVKTTSAKHIVDLAAAIQAGNFETEDEPVVISRDFHAEYDLPQQLEGIIRLYKVELGLHRMAADRLMNGLDAKAKYDQVR